MKRYLPTPEDLALLKEEVCARMPYGVKAYVEWDCTDYDEFSGRTLGGIIGATVKLVGYDQEGEALSLDIIKTDVDNIGKTPNMQERIDEYVSELPINCPVDCCDVQMYLRTRRMLNKDERKLYYGKCRIYRYRSYQPGKKWCTAIFDTVESLSYLRSIHVDTCGMIKKGLALRAPADMYTSKE